MKILYDIEAIKDFYDATPKFGMPDDFDEYVINNFEQVFDQDLKFVGYETKVFVCMRASL